MLDFLKKKLGLAVKEKVTSLAGGGSLVVALIQVLYLFDTDPATNPDWTIVGTALTAAIGLLFASDAKNPEESK